ncbi:glycosyltransferase [Luteimonas sp. MJ204]|uniref:glycosyltransferase n=1 Tax=Luteimonas sp. MJ145 TaxID=3129234 RepID=UPI0031BA0B06
MSEAPHASPGIGRVVLWGTCDTGKPRVRILLQGLRECGVEVIDCHADLWAGIEDKSQIRGIGTWFRLALNALKCYPALLLRYMRLPPHDWVLVGYPSIPDVFVIWPFARLRRARIALDWFLSAYDTIVLDRALIGWRNPLAKLIHATEWAGVRLSDAPFMDTGTHARRMESLFGLAAGSCGRVMVGVETDVFAPMPSSEGSPGGADAPASASGSGSDPLRIIFYGQFIPLHGIETIVAAARLLRDSPVTWTLIGRGQEAARIRAMLDADPVATLQWIDWVEYAELRRAIGSADVCLGIFGTSDKAASVIPNKVFQILAAGKPLITRDSPAIRELVADAPPCIRLVPAGDPGALAEALLLALEARATIRGPCHRDLPAAIAPRAVGTQLTEILAVAGRKDE